MNHTTTSIVRLTLLCLTALLSLPTIAADTPNKPNIILVMTDDQGYGEMSAHGHPVLKTPNLDKLKSQSLAFERFQVSPTCAPTRSAIMSGRAPFYVGVTHTIYERERLALGVPTLPEMLKSVGYTTGIFGKWHLGDQDPYRPDKRGFDEVFIHGAGGIGQSYPGSSGDAPKNKYFDPAILHNNKFVKTKGFCTDIFFTQAMKWIENKKGKTPFFAYISTNAPHGPFISPEKYKAPFIKAKMSKNQIGYNGMVTNIDMNMGRLLAKMKQLDIERDTILIFMTDNGPTGAGSTFNAGMKGKKGSVDEGGTRVPFFIRWPGVTKPGTTVNRIARHLDLLPTFAQITGATPKQKNQLQGRSLLPLIKNPNAQWDDRYLFFHKGRWTKGTAQKAKNKGFAIRSQRYRLIGPNALYDMQKDPGQKHNVFNQHPDITAKMLKAYDTWFAGALLKMSNENAPLTGRNTFHTMFYKQYNITPPQPRKRKPKTKKQNRKPKNK